MTTTLSASAAPPIIAGIVASLTGFASSFALLIAGLRPIMSATRFPAELLPLAILRSLTGSGSLAMATDVIKTHGPDSVIARMAATMYGSSETTFYVLAVYCGAVGVRRTRHAVPAASDPLASQRSCHVAPGCSSSQSSRNASPRRRIFSV